jgi:predicted RNase H-like nuclease (RuvC/YqgF family)
MLQTEFETLTDIFPDTILYEVIEHEYNEGDWHDKAEFCDCFKADEDGLATKCQRIANERWFKAEEHIGKLTAENNRLEDENENLRNEIAALSDRVDKLNSQIEELPTATLEVTEPEITIQSIRAAIQQAYQDAAHDDCTGDQILHMVWGFEYLLQRLGVE